MFSSHPVPIIYASAPIIKPKPIRPHPIDTTNVRAQTCSHRLPPAQSNRLKRPSMLRASTLDGRSLSEVIDAAHRASITEQHRRSSKSSPLSFHESSSSSASSSTSSLASSMSSASSTKPKSRRMSFDGTHQASSYQSIHNHHYYDHHNPTRPTPFPPYSAHPHPPNRRSLSYSENQRDYFLDH